MRTKLETSNYCVMKQRILFVEDEPDLGNVIRQYLEIMNFEVEWCVNGKQATERFLHNPSHFQLVMIDVQLPDISGFDLAERIAAIKPAVPFLFLTARNEKKDRIRGLNIGADDYISKPFDIDELVLRIKNIIRRNQQPGTADNEDGLNVKAGDIVLHKDSLQLNIAGKEQAVLTPREAELLEYLCKNKGRVLKREDILLQLWGDTDYFLGRSLDVFVSRLRKRLNRSASVSIDNVYGIGFIFTVKN